MTASPDLMALALSARAAGLCVLPPREDGSKRPDVPSWERYQYEASAEAEVRAWYAGGRRTGIGYVCGAISGGLELLEFEDAETYRAYVAAAAESGLGELVGRVAAGWEDLTPGGGVHWYLCCPDAGSNTVLARRPTRPEEARHAGDRWRVLVETRGQGGFAIAAPSHGGVHPSGRPYVRLRGGPTTVAAVTPEEQRDLFALARALDEAPPNGDAEPRETTVAAGMGADRPGDDFAARAGWPEILEPHGWVLTFERDGVGYWRRPGKDRGVSATTNWDGRDRFRVFTTSTAFEPGMHSKFAAYAVLEHGGDLAAAARVLAARGFGRRRASAFGGPTSPRSMPLPDVPPFPLDALPPVGRRFVAAGAAALGCPPDFVVPPLFAFVGAAAGNARKLRLKPGYEVAPIFWAGVVGKPGTVKTPALNHARRVLDALQKEAWERYLAEVERWEEEKTNERGAKPRPEHFFATDTTTEAVAWALTTSRGLAVVHDELVGWASSFDAYRKAGDRQTWLSAWSGAPLKPNRKTGEPIYVPDPVVCVSGGVQPDVLGELAGEAARDDGFVPRLLLAWPDAEPSPWTDAVVEPEVVADALRAVRQLRLPGEQVAITTLSPEAKAEWVAWYDENQKLTAAARGLTAGWAAKAPVHLARVTLVLHLLAHPTVQDRALDGATMRDAIAVAEYFRAHLGRVLPAFGGDIPPAGAGLAARVLRVIAPAWPGWVARSDVAAKLGGHEPSTTVGAALASLEAAGRAERRVVHGAGRPREEWRVAPVVGGEGTARDMGEDGESPPPGTFSRNHVSADDPDSNPGPRWERWEEPL